ncbi:polymerase [Streptococcus sp. UMB0029]|uniref:polymerase n=1 Tax=Streptococcus sp. UMB0029 TaxID=2069308 RepID=UPI0021554DD7|nr:polymerase [Streptococcus sp. UMB0029]
MSIVGIVNDRRFSVTYLVLACLSISIIALRYIPHPLDDGAFHFRATQVLTNFDSIISMFQAFESGFRVGRYDYGSVPVFTSLMYLVRNTHHCSLLSFISAFVTYFSFGYVVVVVVVDLFKSYKNYFKLAYILILITVLLLNNYRYTTSGMRFCMTISLIMLIMYLESKFNYAKYWMMLWYLVPISIHSAVVYFVALRFIFFYLKKITVGKSLLVLLSFPIIIKLTPIFSEWTGISFFQSIIRKIDIYSDNTSYVNLFNTTLTMRLYIGVVLMFLFLIQYFVLSRTIKGIDDWKLSFVKMTYYLTLLSMGSVPFRNMYDRNLFLLLPMIVISSFILFTYRAQLKILSNRNLVYGIELSLLGISFITVFFYNKNFPFNFIDYSKTDLLLKNIY